MTFKSDQLGDPVLKDGRLAILALVAFSDERHKSGMSHRAFSERFVLELVMFSNRDTCSWDIERSEDTDLEWVSNMFKIPRVIEGNGRCTSFISKTVGKMGNSDHSD